MRRLSGAVCALVVLLGLGLLVPAEATTGQGRSTDRIELPNGWQPEGITTDGGRLYVGSLANGAIWETSPRTGVGRLLAPGREGRVAVGLDYDRRRDLIWVAGGETGVVWAQDADTGRIVAKYDFGSATPRFLNDLVVTWRAVYVTDSLNQELAVIPLRHRGSGHGHRLPPASAARALPLTGDLVYAEGFNLNGIAAERHLLLAVQSNTGLLFRINPWTGRTRVVDLGGELVTNGDGLELRHGTAYVVRNQDNLIAVVELGQCARTGEVVDELTDEDLDVPSTIAFARGSLWAVNARFATTPTPTTPYWITRVDEYNHGRPSAS